MLYKAMLDRGKHRCRRF